MRRERPQEVKCETCQALCCRMQVILIDDRRVPDAWVAQSAWGGAVMRREADGWCAAVDRDTMRCTIYADRPQVCRDFEMGGSDCLAERRSGERRQG